MTDNHIDLDALYAALDAKRISKKMSFRDVAAELKISPSTLTRLGQGHRPDVNSFAVLIQWLGVPAETFFLDAQKKTKEPEDFLVFMSTHLRARREFSPESATAFENIMKAAYETLARDAPNPKKKR